MKRAQEPRWSLPSVCHLALSGAVILLFNPRPAEGQAGSFTKAVVGDHIRKVEDGVDDFGSTWRTVEKTPKVVQRQRRAAEQRPPAAERPAVEPIPKPAKNRPREPRTSWTMV